MEQNPAEKNMFVSLVLVNFCFHCGNTDIIGKMQLPLESSINNLIILYQSFDKK